MRRINLRGAHGSSCNILSLTFFPKLEDIQSVWYRPQITWLDRVLHWKMTRFSLGPGRLRVNLMASCTHRLSAVFVSVQVKTLKNQFWVPFRPYSVAYDFLIWNFWGPELIGSINFRPSCATTYSWNATRYHCFCSQQKIRLWERVRLFIFYTVFYGADLTNCSLCNSAYRVNKVTFDWLVIWF